MPANQLGIDIARRATAFAAANYGQAERMFKLSIKEAEAFGPKDLRLAASLTNLGVLYSLRDQRAQAAQLFERAIAIKQAALGPENPEVIASVGKICQFYLAHGELDKAQPLVDKLNAFAQKVIRDRQQINISFQRLSTFYHLHQELKDAELLLKQAKEQTQKMTANEDLEFAVVLDGLGQSFKAENKLADAEQLYTNALAIREQSLPKTHAALSESLSHLAKLYSAQGKYDQAEPLFKRAMEITTKALGEEKPESLARIDDLASCYAHAGNNRDAEALFRHEGDLAEKGLW